MKNGRSTRLLTTIGVHTALLAVFLAGGVESNWGAMPPVPAQAGAEESTGPVAEGDLVQVAIAAALPDGRAVSLALFAPAIPADETDGARVLEEVVAGEESEIPGIGAAVIGMQPGERKEVVVPPGKAFPPVDPALKKEFPCEKILPRKITLSPAEYLEEVGGFPVEGQEVRLVPYFPARVGKVEAAAVTLEFLPEDRSRFEDELGAAEVRVEEDRVRILLAPRIGAPFEVDGRPGRIVATDGKTFTVDLNPPLAGETVKLEVTVVSRLPAERLAAMAIPWEEDFTTGMARAAEEAKPAVLVLYADWCQWSGRLFRESLEDARIKALRDRFLWLKVNSDRERDFQERFGQRGFPLVVVLDPQGKVIHTIDGFRTGEALARDLRHLSIL